MIHCEQLQFAYPGESFRLEIGSLKIPSEETVAMVGPSGCGKTTLLHLIAGILQPQEGAIRVAEKNLSTLSLKQRQRFRIGHMGLVPQSFDLLEYLTVRENILLPFRVSGVLQLDSDTRARCESLAETTGVAAHLEKFPSELSTGERQRVTVCRGLIAEPKIILADEPTGNLDPENQDRIVSLLLSEAKKIGATVVMITHEPDLCQRFDRVIDVLALRKGGLE